MTCPYPPRRLFSELPTPGGRIEARRRPTYSRQVPISRRASQYQPIPTRCWLFQKAPARSPRERRIRFTHAVRTFRTEKPPPKIVRPQSSRVLGERSRLWRGAGRVATVVSGKLGGLRSTSVSGSGRSAVQSRGMSTACVLGVANVFSNQGAHISLPSSGRARHQVTPHIREHNNTALTSVAVSDHRGRGA